MQKRIRLIIDIGMTLLLPLLMAYSLIGEMFHEIIGTLTFTPYSKALWTLIGFELLIATIGTIATSTWIGAGLLIKKFYEKHYRIINIILALTLLECIWSMLRA